MARLLGRLTDRLTAAPPRQLWTIVGGVVAVLVLFLGVQTCRLKDAQARNTELALGRVNDQARRDTTERLALARKDSLRILGDSLRGVQHLVIQTRIDRDAIDRALNQSRVVDARIVAVIAALEQRVTGKAPIVEDTAGTRRQSFDVRKEPYTAHAEVELPKPPAPGTLDLRVVLDSARLNARIACLAPNADGIRPASLQVIGPVWLPARVDSVRQDPDVCNGDRAQPRAAWYRKLRYPIGGELREDGCRAVLGGVAYPLGPFDVMAAVSWRWGAC